MEGWMDDSGKSVWALDPSTSLQIPPIPPSKPVAMGVHVGGVWGVGGIGGIGGMWRDVEGSGAQTLFPESSIHPSIQGSLVI